MSWRPEGWENPFTEDKHNDFESVDDSYEAGADAMLEALKGDGLNVDISAGVRVYIGGKPNLLYRTKGTPTGKGKLVFIPDEEE